MLFVHSQRVRFIRFLLLFFILLLGQTTKAQDQFYGLSSSWFSSYSGLNWSIGASKIAKNSKYEMGLKWAYSRSRTPLSNYPSWYGKYTHVLSPDKKFSGVVFGRYDGLFNEIETQKELINEFHFGFGLHYKLSDKLHLLAETGAGGYIQNNSNLISESDLKGISHCINFELLYTLF